MRRGGSAKQLSTERRAWSVSAHLTAVVVLGAVVAGSGVAYAYRWNQAQAHRQAVDRMVLQAQNAAGSTAELLDNARKVVEDLATEEGLAAALQGVPGCRLSFDAPRGFPSARLDLVSATGRVACTSAGPALKTPPGGHAKSRWLASTLRSGKPRLFSNEVDAVTGQPALVVAAPVLGPARSVVGAVAVLYHLQPVADALARTSAGSAGVRFAVLDLASRTVISGPGGSTSGSVLTRVAALPASVRSGTVGDAGSSGFDFGSADVKATSWRIVAGAPSATVLAATRGALWRQSLFGLLALLILAIATWRLDRSVARPLQALTAATRQAGRDLSSGHVVVAGTAETRELGRAFNHMLDVAGAHAAQLSHQATHDALTGAPNKAMLMERARASLAEDLPVAVLTLGINRFRLVNDGFGHDMGDKVLREIAGRLGQAVRAGDTLARFGSDEFVVLAPGLDGGDVRGYVDRLLDSLSAPIRIGQREFALSAAVGIATGTARSTSAARLVRESDTAMRHAKREGLRSHLFGKDLQQVAQTNLTLERELHLALQNDELVVHYQPLVDISSGVIVAAEALVRWQHPTRGLLSPLDFLPLAEHTGQVVAVGEAVLRAACRQAAEWSRQGESIVVAVNVAAAQLRTGAFAALVSEVLAATGLEPRQLCLEVTESSLLTAAERRSEDLPRLRAMGVHLAIDDFGTGYSSLSYLHDLPCDELKIDRSFVTPLGSGESHLVSAIMRMAQAMDLTVVAEGVENQAQLEALAAMGCHLGQGYLFSPAVPAEQLAALMTVRHAAAGRPWDPSGTGRASA